MRVGVDPCVLVLVWVAVLVCDLVRVCDGVWVLVGDCDAVLVWVRVLVLVGD